MQPSLTISLSTEGQLMVQLPGGPTGPLQRAIRLSANPERALAFLTSTLQALSRGESWFGLDGAPSAAQAHHLMLHRSSSDANCAFCRGERQLAQKPRAPWGAFTERKLGDGVVVRRYAPGAASQHPKCIAYGSDLGF